MNDLQRYVEACAASGEAAWQQTKAKRAELKEAAWQQFHSYAIERLGVLADVANFSELRERWAYHHKPTIGTDVVVDLRFDGMAKISVNFVVKKNYVTDLGEWAQGTFPTMDLGFQEYRIEKRLSAMIAAHWIQEPEYEYCCTIQQAMACAKEVHQEKMALRDKLVAEMNAVSNTARPVAVSDNSFRVSHYVFEHLPEVVPPAPKEATKTNGEVA